MGSGRTNTVISLSWATISFKEGDYDMRRKYNNCQRVDGDCTVCSLVNYGRDCHNRPITKLEWSRRMADMTQSELAKKSGVNIRQIQRVELGEAEAGNLTAKNLLAIADALGVDISELL